MRLFLSVSYQSKRARLEVNTDSKSLASRLVYVYSLACNSAVFWSYILYVLYVLYISLLEFVWNSLYDDCEATF